MKSSAKHKAAARENIKKAQKARIATSEARKAQLGDGQNLKNANQPNAYIEGRNAQVVAAERLWELREARLRQQMEEQEMKLLRQFFMILKRAFGIE